MRFSTMQDSSYGGGLPQDQFFGTMSDTMMAATENVPALKDNNPVGEGTMVSNLPLLFANGYPTSLENITMVQLERFIIFMVQCSQEQETPENITEPRWWPKEVKFSNPLKRPKKAMESWMDNLKKLVFRCYTYHRSDYLLRFCSCLARYPREELEYINNWDSTTSLYHKSTGKLLVTFRNENMNYDKSCNSLRKKLLSHNGTAPGNKSKQQLLSRVMVEPPTEDIYLCDNCDAEFTGFEKMKEHERICCDPEPSCSAEGNNSSRSNTPDILTTKPELQQNQFLEYFQLSSLNSDGRPMAPDRSPTTKKNIVRRTSQRVRGTISFARCPTIPLSSPAGLLLAKKSKAIMTEDMLQERLERTERYVVGPALNGSARPKWLVAEAERVKWIVTHKPNRDKLTDVYAHQYRFVNSVKRKPSLSIESQLLYVVCRPVCVVLTRLTQEEIDELKRKPSKHRCPVRRTSASKNESIRAQLQTSVKRKAPEDERKMCTEALIACQANPEKNCEPSPGAVREITTTLRNNITLISLCSSDEEEENQPGHVLSKKNKNLTNNSPADHRRESLVNKIVPTALCTNSCIYPADSTSDWLSQRASNDRREDDYTNNYRSSVMIDTSMHLSPILRPAP